MACVRTFPVVRHVALGYPVCVSFAVSGLRPLVHFFAPQNCVLYDHVS